MAEFMPYAVLLCYIIGNTGIDGDQSCLSEQVSETAIVVRINPD